MIEDAWGKMHPVESIDVILTVSQFKAFDWFRDCGRNGDDYWKAFRKSIATAEREITPICAG